MLASTITKFGYALYKIRKIKVKFQQKLFIFTVYLTRWSQVKNRTVPRDDDGFKTMNKYSLDLIHLILTFDPYFNTPGNYDRISNKGTRKRIKTDTEKYWSANRSE